MVEQHHHRLDDVFHALSDVTRRGMLARLAEEEMTVSTLAEPFDMSLAAASKHIKVLERAGLVRRRVEGRTHLCSLDAQAMREADEWMSFYRRFWTGRLDALERALRKPDKKSRRKK